MRADDWKTRTNEKKKVHTMNHSEYFRMDYSKDGRRKIETNTFREIRESIKKDKRGENSHVPKKKAIISCHIFYITL